MKRTISTTTYGQALLAHVPLCYRVALALTNDAENARELTLATVAGVWQERADNDSAAGIKPILLSALRNRYLRARSDAQAATLEPAATPGYRRIGSPFPVPSV